MIKIVVLAFLTFFLSCGGKGSSVQKDTIERDSVIVAHETVHALSDNIMTVFQDIKGNHWYAEIEPVLICVL